MSSFSLIFLIIVILSKSMYLLNHCNLYVEYGLLLVNRNSQKLADKSSHQPWQYKTVKLLEIILFFVEVHEYKEGTPSQKSYFVELWDIGGSINHANSRQLYYNPVHGE